MPWTFSGGRWKSFPAAGAILTAFLVAAASYATPAIAGPSAANWTFSTAGTHGYRLFVSVSRDRVDVFVSGHAAYVEYEAPVTRKGGSVEGDLGRLGRIAMRFVPTGAPGRSDEPNGCHGPRPTYQKGHAEGTFELRGERGFTSASTRRAPAVAERGYTGLCGQSGGRPVKPDLVARETSGPRTVTVGLYFREYEVTTQAEVREALGDLDVSRVVDRAASLDVASVGADGWGSVSPPFPFHGTARFRPGSTGPAWTGDLRADFPGVGTVPLAGRRFRLSGSPVLPAPVAEGAGGGNLFLGMLSAGRAGR